VLSNDLGVMDASAIALARENNIPVVVFSIKRPGAFAELMQGRGDYTIVMEKEVQNG
jgi:uridylate kinase